MLVSFQILLDLNHHPACVGTLEILNGSCKILHPMPPAKKLANTIVSGMETLDWDTRGTFSLGEAATAALPSQVAEKYVNPLLVVTGSHDSFFCSLLSLDIQILLGAPNCDTTESGPAAQVQPQLYPNVHSFGVLYPDAGHCWHLHYTAPETFAQVHDWLASEGF